MQAPSPGLGQPLFSGAAFGRSFRFILSSLSLLVVAQRDKDQTMRLSIGQVRTRSDRKGIEQDDRLERYKLGRFSIDKLFTGDVRLSELCGSASCRGVN